MPNHWESSARPLFVKTVFVNGNRHAILSQEDPVLRSGVSSSKKQSRPNSSLSFSSDPSISGSDSRGSSPEERIRSSKPRKVHLTQEKDMSSDLQSCYRLIKLRLASSIRENKSRSKDDNSLDNSQEETSNGERGNFKQKRKKWNRSKTGRKNTEQNESMNENSSVECKNGRDRRYYVYNFENNKGKKNYCFVKISSKASKFILNCSCDNNFCGSKDTLDKNNVVISATFHNLVMTSEKNEKLFNNSTNYIFSFGDSDSREIWNNYVAKSYYNSLTERVLQWLEMANRQKNRERKSDMLTKDLSINNVERIFVGETFLKESDKTKNFRTPNRVAIVKENLTQKEVSQDVETEVRAESNIETVLSREKLKNNSGEISTSSKSSPMHTSGRESRAESEQIRIQNEQNLTLIPISQESGSVENHFDKVKSSIDFQNLLLSSRSRDQFSGHTKRRLNRERRSFLSRQSKCNEPSEAEDTDEENFKMTDAKYWERRLNVRGELENKPERYKETINFNYAGCLKTQILTQEFTAKSQKSINNPNITRTRPAFSQNLLSPQQHNISWLREGKIVRSSEKDLGRPQLHIFMPSIPVRDPEEESMSECESFLDEAG